jgi:hypothetical protein
MTYPSQPGYQTSPYGQPQSPQQNNLWLIGGAILVVLIILMTVILLVVQQTAADDTTEGGDGGTTGAEPTADATSETETDGDGDGGDTGGGGTIEINADACDAYDMTQFEEAYGTFVKENVSRSSSTSGGLNSLNCTFPNGDATSVTVYVTDFEDASFVVEWVESDAEYYNEENGYELSEYTEIGNAGTMYTSTNSGSKSIYIHVAIGSLEVKAYTTLWEGESIEEGPAIETLEDIIRQSETLFADYT